MYMRLYSGSGSGNASGSDSLCRIELLLPAAFFLSPALVGTCGAMPVVAVSLVLCFNGCSVPLETQTLPFVDPYDLAEEPDELLPVSLVKGPVVASQGPGPACEVVGAEPLSHPSAPTYIGANQGQETRAR